MTQRHCLLTTASTTFRPKARSLFLLWNNTSLGRMLGTSLLWNNTSLGRRLGDSIVEQCESSVQFPLSTSRFESRSWNSACYLRHYLVLLTTWYSVGFLSVSVFVVINGQNESTLHAVEVAKLQHVGISEIYSTKAQICIMAACWKYRKYLGIVFFGVFVENLNFVFFNDNRHITNLIVYRG